MKGYYYDDRIGGWFTFDTGKLKANFEREAQAKLAAQGVQAQATGKTYSYNPAQFDQPAQQSTGQPGNNNMLLYAALAIGAIIILKS